MKHQLLLVSYHRDFPWMFNCLRSMEKYAKGFGVTVVVPTRDSDALMRTVKPLCDRWDNEGYPFPISFKVDEEPAGLGQLFSQVTKCSADVFVPNDTEYVHFIDSDCLLTREFTPEHLMHDGKPWMTYNSYQHCHKVGCASVLWQKVVEANLKFPVANEFLRNMPLSYPIALFSRLRTHIEKVHSKRFADYVFGTGKNSWPQLFCESNDLAAYAWEHMHGIYTWVNLDNGAPDWRYMVMQFWSHGGMDRPIDRTDCVVPFLDYKPGDILRPEHRTPRQITQAVLG